MVERPKSKRKLSSDEDKLFVDRWNFIVNDNKIAIEFNNKPIKIIIKDVYSPFESTSLDPNSTRKSILLRLPECWDTIFSCMEACVLHAVQEKKLVQQVTNKKYSSEEIESNYKPVSHKREQYPRIMLYIEILAICKVFRITISSIITRKTALCSLSHFK